MFFRVEIVLPTFFYITYLKQDFMRDLDEVTTFCQRFFLAVVEHLAGISRTQHKPVSNQCFIVIKLSFLHLYTSYSRNIKIMR